MVEKQKKFASLAFRKHYDTLQTAISTPDLVNSLASKLYKRLLITKETRDAVQFTTGISPMDKAAMLLQAVESTIQIDKHCLFRFVRLLKKQPILKPFAEKLRKEYSKWRSYEYHNLVDAFYTCLRISIERGYWLLELYMSASCRCRC